MSKYDTYARDPYARPALKLKFWTLCSCVVLRINEGRRSVELGLGGRSVSRSRRTMTCRFRVRSSRSCTCMWPQRGGSPLQPVCLGVRDDIDAGECTAEAQNLKYKAAA